MSAEGHLVAWWAVFIGSHLVASHPPWRGRLVARCGSERRFKVAYSLVSGLLALPLVGAWWEARPGSPWCWWVASVPLRTALKGSALLGFALIGGGLGGPRQGDAVGVDGDVVGMPALVRHPPFAGVVLWAMAHLLLTGRRADVLFFLGFLVLTVAGGAHRDWRRAAEEPPYRRFVTLTSWWPRLGPTRLRRVGGRAWIGAACGAAVGLFVHALHARVLR